jgi:large subunit ribosomal protein L21
MFVFTEEEATMYAVIRLGGKQYRVTPGQTIRLEKVAGDIGSKVELKDVLLVENDGNVQVGVPLVANAMVEATVVEHDRAKKIIVFKKKRKKQYRRTQGHRQDYTAVRIDKITV